LLSRLALFTVAFAVATGSGPVFAEFQTSAAERHSSSLVFLFTRRQASIGEVQKGLERFALSISQ